MQERLQDLLFIREMIKNSRKVAKAVAETDTSPRHHLGITSVSVCVH